MTHEMSGEVLVALDSTLVTRDMETQEVQTLFSVPNGMHPVITAIRTDKLTAGDRVVMMVDPEPGLESGLGLEWTLANVFLHPTATAVAWRKMPTAKRMFLFDIDGGEAIDFAGRPYPVRNRISFSLSIAADVNVFIYYDVEEGHMNFLDEWADLIGQKQNVAGLETSAGGLYHQVGQYFQIGRREF